MSATTEPQACECGGEPCEDGRWPELCWECVTDAWQDQADQAAIDRSEDRELFPEDYEDEWFGGDEILD